ncbi:immunoglobulin kappa light chain-like isoform X2 [Notolabrus celidotus]|nr:immunoglobulin kappa light chain-like isoform X2 [Notolabrus celidotus]
MMTSLKLALLLICLYGWIEALTSVSRLHASVRQESDYVSANFGDNVTLRCFYKGNVAAMIYWYKQALGQKPRLISSFYKHDTKATFSDEFKDDPRFTMESDSVNNHLTITHLQPSDSGTYYCMSGYAYNFQFVEGTSVSVKGSGWNITALVHESASETTRPGGSMSCTVNAGSCDGEHRVYWIKNSEESQPGLIYTHGGRSDQCERKPNTETNTCVYNLPTKNLNLSHAGTYYCEVAACGHILFGNRSKSDLADENNSPGSLVLFLSGSLAFTSILVVLLTVSVYSLNKGSCRCSESPRVSATTTESNQDPDNLHYAALRGHRANRSRTQRVNRDECVYSSVRQ